MDRVDFLWGNEFFDQFRLTNEPARNLLALAPGLVLLSSQLARDTQNVIVFTPKMITSYKLLTLH